MKVFVLYFMGPSADGSWFGKFIGVYSSQRETARAVERLQGRPGYSHYPKGFQVECVHLDEDYDGSANLGPVPPTPLPPPC
jgi:hypothetical protein